MNDPIITFLLIAVRTLPVVLLVCRRRVLLLPWRWCFAITVLLAMMQWPIQPIYALQPDDFILAIAIGESLVGLTLALCLTMLLDAMQLAATVITQCTGLGLNSSRDVAAVGLPLERFFAMFALAVVFATGAHESLVRLLLESYRLVPLATEIDRAQAARLLGELLAQGLQIGVQIVIPIYAVLIGANLLVGFIARLAPQLGSVNWGSCALTAIALLMLAILTPRLVELLPDATRIGIGGWRQVMADAAHPPEKPNSFLP